MGNHTGHRLFALPHKAASAQMMHKEAQRTQLYPRDGTSERSAIIRAPLVRTVRASGVLPYLPLADMAHYGYRCKVEVQEVPGTLWLAARGRPARDARERHDH